MFGQKVLLLNASNMDTYPLYPYAFIQVPAVARRAGIEVICKDLLGLPQDNWKPTIQTLIEFHNPAMILITLRNTDSFDSPDYEWNSLNEGERSAYFPIERTRELITAIRAISDLKITLGGFSFSLLPHELMQYLRPDFGVLGGRDDFCRRDFAEQLAAQTQSVLPEWKRDLLQFCVQAILYKFNVLVKQKYRQLFVSV